MPIVFWASLPPCPRLYSAADTNCNLRKSLSTWRGDLRRKIQEMATMKPNPSTNPMNGATTMKISVFVQPRE